MFRDPSLRSCLLVLGFTLLLALNACSTPSSSTSPLGKTHRVRQLFFESLRYRRPLVPSADPQASPGGADYKTVLEADFETLDCKKPDDFVRSAKAWSGTDAERVLACLESITEPLEVEWRLRRGNDPAWVLSVEDKPIEEGGTPSCIRELFPEIPIPREIVFEGLNEEGLRSCFTSRPNWDEDLFLGFRVPYFAKKGLRVQFPIELRSLAEKSEDRLQSLLTSWIMPIFLDEGGLSLPSVVFSDSLCRKCVGEATLRRLRDPNLPAVPLWNVK